MGFCSGRGVMRVRSIAMLGGAVLLVAAAGPEDCQGPHQVVAGTWGGEHMGMVVADTGASIEYDCASGRITQPLTLGPGGDFSWTGLFFPGHPGPVRVGDEPAPHAAVYSGRVSGDEMKVTLRVPDSLDITQSFTLRRGASSNVFRCL